MEQLMNILRHRQGDPFMFTSTAFWVFFGVVLFVHALVYRRQLLRTGFLFLASLFFYYKAGGYFFFLLVISTIVDFFIGLGLEYFTKNWKRKLLLIISLTVNLGMLAYFKYAWFFADVWADFSGQSVEMKDWLAVLSNAMFDTQFNVENIILPVGISFFTFQTISYSMDVYRRQVAPVHNIIDFGFYVSFFPQLVAGPIVRAREFVPQIYRPFVLTEKQVWHATFLIITGLVKKMVFSDYIAVNLIDRVFESPFLYSGFENLSAIYGYALQIYFDFSGYTDVAIGLALLMGFRLPLNFNTPYKSLSPTEFWRRWHISLSTWLRDYLYIPLGGNRKGKLRTHINILITMTLGGLWHGASWRFVLWGLWHGAGLVIDKLIKPLTTRLPAWIRSGAGLLVTFHFVVAGWILFRAPDLQTASTMTERIFMAFNAGTIFQALQANILSYGLILTGFSLHWLPESVKEIIRGWFISMHWTAKVALVAIAVVVIWQFRTAELVPFIYFRF